MARKEMYRGARVRFEGRLGTVVNDSDKGWVTASVEFDDEKGIVIQKDKDDLEYAVEEYERVPLEDRTYLTSEDRQVGKMALVLMDEGGYTSLDLAVRTAHSLYRAGARVEK